MVINVAINGSQKLKISGTLIATGYLYKSEVKV